MTRTSGVLMWSQAMRLVCVITLAPFRVWCEICMSSKISCHRLSSKITLAVGLPYIRKWKNGVVVSIAVEVCVVGLVGPGDSCSRSFRPWSRNRSQNDPSKFPTGNKRCQLRNIVPVLAVEHQQVPKVSAEHRNWKHPEFVLAGMAYKIS